VLTLASRVNTCKSARREWSGPHPRAAIYAGLQEDRASRRSGQLLTKKSFAKRIANPTKSGVFQAKTMFLLKAGVKRRTATPLFIGGFILLRFVVDHIAQHREQH
jgi:hypothetical protein